MDAKQVLQAAFLSMLTHTEFEQFIKENNRFDFIETAQAQKWLGMIAKGDWVLAVHYDADHRIHPCIR